MPRASVPVSDINGTDTISFWYHGQELIIDKHDLHWITRELNAVYDHFKEQQIQRTEQTIADFAARMRGES